MSQDRDYLTEAIEAAREEAADWLVPFADAKVIDGAAEAAVRAAAPIIERAVRDAIVARVEAEFIAGAVVPEWAQAGRKPTAAGIRRWVIGIVRG